jgi:hypothetical protein
MSNEWPTRVVFWDKIGNPLWFNPREAVASWVPSPVLNMERPVDGFATPVLSFLPSGVWCLWDSCPVPLGPGRPARVLSEAEALKLIFMWDLDPGQHGEKTLAAMDVGAARHDEPTSALNGDKPHALGMAAFNSRLFIETAEDFSCVLSLFVTIHQMFVERNEVNPLDGSELLEEFPAMEKLIDRISHFLLGGELHRLETRHRTLELLRGFWGVFEPISNEIRACAVSNSFPKISIETSDLLESYIRRIREIEGIRFVSPEDEQQWVNGEACKTIRETIGGTQTDALAYLLEKSRQLQVSPNELSRMIVEDDVFPPTLASGNTGKDETSSSPGFTPAELSSMLGITTERVNHYAKSMQIATPGRGQREHRYSQSDTKVICQGIRNSSAAKDTKENAAAVLLKLGPISKSDLKSE